MDDVPQDLLKKSSCTIKTAFADLLNVRGDRYLEVEARLGIILDRRSGSRVSMGAAHPVILSSQKPDFYFQSGVSTSFFQNAHRILAGMESVRAEEVVVVKNKIRAIYSCGKRMFMRKVRLRTFEIHFPSCQYDVRVSFSKEELLGDSEHTGALMKKGPGLRRERDRMSVSTKFYRFDLTSVKTPESISHEIEIEVTDFGFNRDEFFCILENMAR
eukprot:jgi/Antlo1/329/1655